MKFELPEDFRLTNEEHPMATQPGERGGVFVIPRKPKLAGRKPVVFYHVTVSEQFGWDHLAVVAMQLDKKTGQFTPRNRPPDFHELDALKKMFWDDHTMVMQLHIPETLWKNQVPNQLHLWAPRSETLVKIPVPSPLMVGMTGIEVDQVTGKVTQTNGASLERTAIFRNLAT